MSFAYNSYLSTNGKIWSKLLFSLQIDLRILKGAYKVCKLKMQQGFDDVKIIMS